MKFAFFVSYVEPQAQLLRYILSYVTPNRVNSKAGGANTSLYYGDKGFHGVIMLQDESNNFSLSDMPKRVVWAEYSGVEFPRIAKKIAVLSVIPK